MSISQLIHENVREMNTRSKLTSFAITALLVLTPFLQITPAVATNLSDMLNVQMPETSSSFRPVVNLQSSSSSSNQLINQFLADWDSFQNLTAMLDRSIVAGFMTSQIKALNVSVLSS